MYRHWGRGGDGRHGQQQDRGSRLMSNPVSVRLSFCPFSVLIFFFRDETNSTVFIEVRRYLEGIVFFLSKKTQTRSWQSL